MKDLSQSQINNRYSQNFLSQSCNNFDRSRNSRPGYNTDSRGNYRSGPQSDFRNWRPRFCDFCRIKSHFTHQCRQAHIEQFINGRKFCKYCKVLNHRVEDCHRAQNARRSRFYRKDSRFDRDASQNTRYSGRVPNRPVNLINLQILNVISWSAQPFIEIFVSHSNSFSGDILIVMLRFRSSATLHLKDLIWHWTKMKNVKNL